jgi:methylated-DNA-[protein]-cysteine S-methyltransferase
MNYLSIETPIGKLTIAEKDGFLTSIFFDGEEPKEITQSETPVLKMAKTQLQEYFNRRRNEFDVPIKPVGGFFHMKVWETMVKQVPFGTTVSYSDIAKMVGNPKAARAVGMANNRNPIPIIIPCHRIVGKGGKLTGFRPGLDIKEKLLILES